MRRAALAGCVALACASGGTPAPETHPEQTPARAPAPAPLPVPARFAEAVAYFVRDDAWSEASLTGPTRPEERDPEDDSMKLVRIPPKSGEPKPRYLYFHDGRRGHLVSETMPESSRRAPAPRVEADGER